jgi:hypothetical protein
VVDWNEDGLHDLLMGAENKELGSVPPSTRIYLNSGSTGNPVFTTYSELYCSGDPIEPHRCIPWVTDLNGDGKKDLVCGIMEGYYLYFENTGTNQNPSFSSEDTLRYSGGSVIHEGSDTRPVITDWNEDGVPDIVSGFADGTVTVFPGQPTGVEESFHPLAGQVSVVNPSRGLIVVVVSPEAQCGLSLRVFDCGGRIVGAVTGMELSQGRQEVILDAGDLPTGAYAVVLDLGEYRGVYRVILLD